MTTKVICVASAKGGSGKTVFTSALGHLLAALNRRTLVIDTDAATNGLSLFYLNEVITQREKVESQAEDEGKSARLSAAGIFELAQGKGQLRTVALGPKLDLLPATFRFLNTESVSADSFLVSLEETLDLAEESYDFVLLDAQAGSDSIAAISMRPEISDQVVLVSEYDPLSAAGAERLKSLFPEALTYERTWMLINKMLPEFAPSLGEFLHIAKYLSPIPWNAEVVRAYAQRSLALDLKHGNDYTLAITQAARGLLGPDMEADIDKWIDARAAAVREPINRQIHDLETEAEGIILERRKLRRQGQQVRIGGFGAAVLFALLGVVAALGTSQTGPLMIGLALAFLVGFVANYWRIIAELMAVIVGIEVDIDLEVTEGQLRRREQNIDQRLRSLQALAETDPEELLRSGKRPPASHTEYL